MEKKYTSLKGDIRILCTDRPDNKYSVIGMDSTGKILFYTEDGKCESNKDYNLVEIWEPQHGEWCLFWDSNKQNGAALSRFYKMQSDGTFQSWNGITWEYCSKFDGTLPEHLQV